jgi:hypothetical protein
MPKQNPAHAKAQKSGNFFLLLVIDVTAYATFVEHFPYFWVRLILSADAVVPYNALETKQEAHIPSLVGKLLGVTMAERFFLFLNVTRRTCFPARRQE